MLDIEALKQPVGDDSAVGPNLRDEPDFRDIEDMPGQFATMKPPELRKVVEKCAEWLGRTKDQALILVAAKAAVRMNDLASVQQLLALLKDFVDNHWDDYHPGPAEEMGDARVIELSTLATPAAMLLPLQRLALAALPPPGNMPLTAGVLAQSLEPLKAWDSDDDERLGNQVENGSMTQAAAKTYRQHYDGGRTLRSIMRVLSADARAADEAAGIDPVDMEMPGAQVEALALKLRGDVSTAREQLSAILDLLYELMEAIGNRGIDSPSFGPVISQLKTMVDSADRFTAAFQPPGDPEAAPQESEGAGANPAAGGTVAAPRGFMVTTPRTRDDVMTALDAIASYYSQWEPTSPVPLMLKRVRAWVRMDFMELIEEIAPGSVDDAKRLLAIPED